MRLPSALSSQWAEAPRAPNLAPLRRLLPYLARYRVAAVGAVAASIIAAGTVLSFGLGLRALVDQGFAVGDADLLDRALLLLLLAVVVLAAASFARFALVSWIGERVIADLRRDVYARVVRLDPGFFETTKTAEIVSRLSSDTGVMQVVVSASASVFLRNLLLLVGGTVMLVITSPRLTGLVALVIPLVLVPILVYGRKVRRLSRESQDRIADVGGHVDETLSAIRTVQAFTQEAASAGRMEGQVEAALDVARRRILARAILTATVIVLTFGAVGVILWIGGRDVIAGRLSGGALSAFVFYAVAVAGALGTISEVLGDVQQGAGAAERVVELIEARSAIAEPTAPVALPAPPEGRLTFENVRFNYPSRPGQLALDGIDLAVSAGRTTAIVGPSGAGKSTLFQLLLRFYDPARGRILFDGVDIKSCGLAELRRNFALVPQEPMLFSTSALENIRFGRPDASRAEVEEAADAANALGFLRELPEGLDTFLGERGVRVSGGQRQRLAIARAVLADPTVLLLDEATSALDSESERLIQQALARLTRGRTTLIVAHRLATVRRAERILVLDGGRLVAVGSHDSLLAEGGLYARLAELQFQDAGNVAGRIHLPLS